VGTATKIIACRAIIVLGVFSVVSVARGHDSLPAALGLSKAPRAPGLTIATNFGLFREHADSSWHWACESSSVADAAHYLFSYEPEAKVFAIGERQIASLAADGCTWRSAEGLPGGPVVQTGLILQTQRLFALVNAERNPVNSAELLVADAADLAFQSVYQVPRDWEILSLAVSADGGPCYLAGGTNDTYEPLVLRSLDSGSSWQRLEQLPTQGAGVFRVPYLEESAAHTTLLQFSGASGSQLFWADDSSEGFHLIAEISDHVLKAVALGGGELALLVRNDQLEQQLLVGPIAGPYRRAALGLQFQDLIMESDQLYGLIRGLDSGLSVAVSTDRGDSWAVMSGLGRDASVRSCSPEPDACLPGCNVLATTGVLSASACQPVRAAMDAPDAAASDLPAIDAPARTSKPTHCAIQIVGSGSSQWIALWLAAVVLSRSFRRRALP
jgi:hypothetical protein